jgi:hypothetical protein
MFNSQRLSGLELLRSIGAPVPNWQVVRTALDVDDLKLPATETGWTVRSCWLESRREMGLFYGNYLESGSVAEILRKQFVKVGSSRFFIVYPSWLFRFSCNIVFQEQTFIVEGKFGSQKSLSIGASTPDFGLRIPFGFRSQMDCYTGSPNDEVLQYLGRILWWCRRIPYGFFYTEVALTSNSTLMFYELFDLQRDAIFYRSWT